MISHPDSIELKLLAGDSFYVDDIEIKPFTLKEIKSMSLSNYQYITNWLIASKDDLKHILDVTRYSSYYDIMLFSGNDEVSSMILNSLCAYLRFEQYGITDDFRVVLQRNDNEKIYIDKDKFERIIGYIKYQNGLIKNNEDKYNPKDEKTKGFIDRMKQLSDKVNKLKNRTSDEEEIKYDFADLVSAVCVKSPSYNLFNIWDLTMYQFIDQFKRLKLIDDYGVSIQSIMQGSKVQATHWISKM